MARRLSTDQWFEEFARLRDGRLTEDPTTVLSKALNTGGGHVVARAAKLVEEFELSSLEDDLERVFHILIGKAAKSDPNCAAKTAIARALLHLELNRIGVFIKGIEHVQIEAVYGGSVDTAAELRGVCAMGLAASGHPDAVLRLAVLLADPESVARQGAARALAVTGRPSAFPLLVFKMLSVDPELAVTGECMSSALTLDPETALPYVSSLVRSTQIEIVEEAAMALGSSRLASAENVLQSTLQETHGQGQRKAMIHGLSLVRSDSAVEYLLELAKEDSDDVFAVIRCMAAFRHDKRVVKRLRTIVESKQNARLSRVFREAFS